MTLVLRKGLVVLEDVRIEELFVGSSRLPKGLWSLGVELEGCLVEL